MPSLSSPHQHEPYYEDTPAQWLFTQSDLDRTPSRIEGMSRAEELLARRKGINFITQAGILLKLDQITLATASIYLQRFYMRHPLQIAGKGAHHYQIAATAVYVAYKTKENPRKMHELIVAVSRVAQKDPNLMIDEQSKEFWKWRDTVQHHENLMLEVLCFDLDPVLPYPVLYDFLKILGVQENKRLRNIAWAVCTDSFSTVLCLLVQPQSISGAALYIGLKHADIRLNDDDYGRSWWEQLGLDTTEMALVIEIMLDTYEDSSISRKQQDGIYIKDSDSINFEMTRQASPGTQSIVEDEEDRYQQEQQDRDTHMNNTVARADTGSEEGELG